MVAGVVCRGADSDGSLTSIYTNLTEQACPQIKENQETGSTVRRCPGIGGYQLLVEDDDARMSVKVVTPSGEEHELSYWTVITPKFSSLGAKAEWRVAKRGSSLLPVGLIVRVEARESETAKKTSYLAVAKITPREICVTQKVAPSADANQRAREAADRAASAACLGH